VPSFGFFAGNPQNGSCNGYARSKRAKLNINPNTDIAWNNKLIGQSGLVWKNSTVVWNALMCAALTPGWRREPVLGSAMDNCSI